MKWLDELCAYTQVTRSRSSLCFIVNTAAGELTALVSPPTSLRFFITEMSRFERGTSLKKRLQISIHLRSIHEAIPRLCGFLLKTERWFLQILEHSLTALPKGAMAAMFTPAIQLNPRTLRNDIFLFIGWRRLYKGVASERLCCSYGIGCLYHETRSLVGGGAG